MRDVIFPSMIVDQYVILIDHEKVINERYEHIIHHSHECLKNIAQSKWHH